MFEYLMPLLVMRSYPRRCSTSRAGWRCGGRSSTRQDRGVPWGISGVGLQRRRPPRQLPVQGLRRPGLGLKRGPRRRAGGRPLRHGARRDGRPRRGRAQPAAPRREGLEGAYGFYEAIDYTHAGPDEARERPPAPLPGHGRARVLGAPPGHDLVALANALLGDRDGRSASTPTRACRPRSCCCRSACRARRPITRAAAGRGNARGGAARRRAPCAASARRTRAFRTRSSSRTAATPRRGHQRRRRRQLLPRPRGDPARATTRRATPAASSSTCATCAAARSGRPPTSRRGGAGRLRGDVPAGEGDLPAPRRRHRDAARDRGLDRGRRRGAAACGDQPQRPPREIEVTSYAEIVARPPADDLAHPAFGKLFIETEYLPERRAALPPPAARRDEPGLGRARAEPRGPAAGAGGVGDRPRALPGPRARPRGPRRRSTGARSRAPPGVVLDPIVSLRQRVRLAPGGFVRLSFATGMALDREPRRRPGPEATATRAPPRAPSRWPSRTRRAPAPPRHLERGGAALRAPGLARALRRRLAARGAGAAWPATRSARRGCGRTASRATSPILLVRVVEEDDLPLVRQVLQAQEYWRLKGLSADVVILNEHPVSYLDEMHDAAHGAARRRAVADLEAPAGRRVPAARRPHGRGRAHPARGRGARRPRGDRGELANQLDRPPECRREPPSTVSPPARARAAPPPEAAPVPPLTLANGLGGFADDGREYVIVLEGDARRRRCRGPT